MTAVLTEKLFASHLLLEMADDRLRPNERVVRQSLTGWDAINWEDSTHIDAALVALLRTGAVFVMDADDCAGALLTLPPELPQLPPLPFRRVLIEMSTITDKQIQQPTPWAWVVEDDGQWRVTEVYEGRPLEHTVTGLDATTNEWKGGWEIPLVGVVERVPRYVWDVILPLRRLRPGRAVNPVTMEPVRTAPLWQISVAVMQITPDGVMDSMSDATDPVREWMKEWAHRNIVNVAHILTAKGAPRTPVPMPRPQRRRWQKRYGGQAMPTIYRVDLHAAGEDKPPTSEREITVRFMVRGHWRHLANGQELCSCPEHRFNPQPATWIDAHVRGPAGAPWSKNTQARWKGRGVYFQRRPRAHA